MLFCYSFYPIKNQFSMLKFIFYYLLVFPYWPWFSEQVLSFSKKSAHLFKSPSTFSWEHSRNFLSGPSQGIWVFPWSENPPLGANSMLLTEWPRTVPAATPAAVAPACFSSPGCCGLFGGIRGGLLPSNGLLAPPPPGPLLAPLPSDISFKVK